MSEFSDYLENAILRNTLGKVYNVDGDAVAGAAVDLIKSSDEVYLGLFIDNTSDDAVGLSEAGASYIEVVGGTSGAAWYSRKIAKFGEVDDADASQQKRSLTKRGVVDSTPDADDQYGCAFLALDAAAAEVTITGIGIFDTDGNIDPGNLLYYTGLTNSKTLTPDDRLIFNEGSITVTLD
jgi:hypothetical protein